MVDSLHTTGRELSSKIDNALFIKNVSDVHLKRAIQKV